MNFKEFTKQVKENVCGIQIQEESECCGHKILLSTTGRVFVDFKLTDLTSIEEAKTYIKQIKLEEEIVKDLYQEIPHVKIAKLIHEYHSIKVTDTLIESYLKLASSKTFSIDQVIHEIRKFNSIDSLLENKIDYELEDGSIVVISEETQQNLTSILEDKYQLVEYMRESKDNFMHVLRELS